MPDESALILKAKTVDGLTVMLSHEDANHWSHPGAVEELLHAFMTTGLQALRVRSDFKPLVLKIAKGQFKGAYGANYQEREDWRRLFGTNTEEDGPPLAASVEIYPIPEFLRRHT